ncbi:hypothetical protein COT99_02945 [Candidatus Falkowbacteria bacterium CG10_big_fil_rev_8_21_14_0_10_43_10]|uniref:UDP-N-acetylmuramoyl-tripeptide--D-alanyl-D-alanine ligase n=1 Tax=Candidatus Falkowbacteria bacterium CG10_big_fil_rev_8_21_14_0_10_43_10 TaxID=1974567 RepID=A0A2H0V1U7_9BACT|nr:MAG: hypothetical protein COT99_02945 [Candidatus Falkowbacteria bacterium CG10_big_fil_rev_8_21_14_0_10_43_10]
MRRDYFMKKLLQLKLKIFAKLILWKYKPRIIGITGSVGKTSAKEAVYTVLASKYNVRRSSGNYNNEIGLPLTIIGAESPGKNIGGWVAVVLRAVRLILLRDRSYPRILILEMGVDRPKDMKYLLKIVKPYIGIVTKVDAVHLENFKKLSDIKEEKERLVAGLDKDGWAILNIDDQSVAGMKNKAAAKKITYGFNKKADITADYVNFSYSGNSRDINNLQGISFKVSYQGAVVPILMPRSLGTGQVYAALAAVAVGGIYGINMVEAAQALKKFNPPKGRTNLIKGIKNSIIIDDSYNAAPASTSVALDLLSKVPLAAGRRRVAVLGDMLELGYMSIKSHQEIGRQAARLGIDILITVGERARDIARAAEKAGTDGNHIFNFDNSDEAKKFIEDRIKPGDLILVKGSQRIRMEKIVKEIMAEPEQAGELLVRQSKEWLKK